MRQTHNQGKRGFHHNSRDSESKAPQRQREVNFTFKSLSIFQIFQSFNILSIVILTIMADKINKKKNAENSTEVSLKTPSDFQGPSNRQKLQSSTEFDGSTISACFSNILEKFTIKQADIMGSFIEVLANNRTKNINKISNEIGKKLETFNDSLIAHKAKSSTGVATISINPNKTKVMRAATISVNSKSTSRANASVEDGGGNSCSSHDCQQEDIDMRKGKRKHVTNLKVNKKVIRETGDSHPPVEDELSLYGDSDLDEQRLILQILQSAILQFCKFSKG